MPRMHLRRAGMRSVSMVEKSSWQVGTESGMDQSPAPRFAVYAVLVLFFCHMVALASSQILNILVEPIRGSLSISDIQISLLQGLAFAILAAIAGIPAAR